MEALDHEPSAAFCYGAGIYWKPPDFERLQKPRRFGEDIFWDLVWDPQFGMSSVMVRRDCFEQSGLFDSRLRMGEDWDMWLRIAARWTGCYVPAPLVVYRIADQEGKYSSKLFEHCTLRVIERLFARQDWDKKTPCLDLYRRLVYAWHYSVLAKSHLRQKRIPRFMKLALASVCSHSRGVYFLARRWSTSGEFPCIKTQDAVESESAQPRDGI
jgi:hypothetical protein